MENVHVLTPHASNTAGLITDAANFFRPQEQEDVHGLVVKLQKTLNLAKLVNIFAAEASKLISINGLQFHGNCDVVEICGSVNNTKPSSFELEVEGERLGQLIYFTDDTINGLLKEKLQRLHSVLVYPLRNALMFHRVKKLATKDPLTSLSNRTHFNEYLTQKLERCRRHHRSFGLMLLDLDNFKQVNDCHGHYIGDQVLREFAKVLTESTRVMDTVFRFGGDEFAILVDDNQENVCSIIAQRIQDNIRQNIILNQHQITCSIGFSLAKANDSQKSIFERADSALYRAKNAGRDCCKIG